eukprot:CAMPEP_0204588324 /NCGR_PEP_ID=MMETSP0661-20131031/48555_1 /ASSEMBLY_ACC=CAM_ASM_000606 /TAXON_ID=109239 /ORGANISM="Alexandrium margalefi, Strain AMGDE01CS-322" /LENGTH=225 /DNA_ID=CAMNT_0051598131 /DNA_START=35 /DNA_END=712 /DNA_ORIENTATION=-
MAGSRVFVGNLDWKVSSEELKEHMEQVGEVVFATVFEESSGRSRGNGIVEYKMPEGAEAAIAELHDTRICERMIFVREDRDGGKKGGKGGFGKGKGKGKGKADYGKGGFGKGDSDRGGYGSKDGGYSKGKGKGKGDRFSYGPQDDGRVVYVGNLPFRASWQDLKDEFKQHGEVIRVEIAQDADGVSKGYATVLFERAEDAESAVNALHDVEFQGRSMKVRMFSVM